jgi:hypothetical protein
MLFHIEGAVAAIRSRTIDASFRAVANFGPTPPCSCPYQA